MRKIISIIIIASSLFRFTAATVESIEDDIHNELFFSDMDIDDHSEYFFSE